MVHTHYPGQLERRLHGLETEYGAKITSSRPLPLSGELIQKINRIQAEEFQARLSGFLGTPNDTFAIDVIEAVGKHHGFPFGKLDFFLPNGARCYLDTGFHPEYSTAEGESIRNVVHGDFAGELVLERAVHLIERLAGEEGREIRGDLFKNNMDTAHLFEPRRENRVSDSYGCHENYTVHRELSLEEYANALIPHFVTRQIYTGAGRIAAVTQGKIAYHIGARSAFIHQEFGVATTGYGRSLFNTRDEPHAAAELYRRLHVIPGDSNMAAVPNYMKLGTTAMILSLVEEGLIDDNFLRKVAPINPLRAIRQTARDITCKLEQIEVQDGYVSPLFIQCQYYELALKHRNIFAPQYHPILDKWGQLLDILDKDPMDAKLEIDWVAKWIMIDNYLAKSNGNLKGAVYVDLRYHNIIRGKGSVRGKISFDKGPLSIDDTLVANLVDDVPNEERARIRGKFVQLMKNLGYKYPEDWRTDWVYVLSSLEGKRNWRLMKLIHGNDPSPLKEFFLESVPLHKRNDREVLRIISEAFPN